MACIFCDKPCVFSEHGKSLLCNAFLLRFPPPSAHRTGYFFTSSAHGFCENRYFCKCYEVLRNYSRLQPPRRGWRAA